MYLEIIESFGKAGEVRFNPYSYTYTGAEDEIAEFLESEPVYAKPKTVPASMNGTPEYQEITSELSKLRLTKQRLRNRGAWQVNIING